MSKDYPFPEEWSPEFYAGFQGPASQICSAVFCIFIAALRAPELQQSELLFWSLLGLCISLFLPFHSTNIYGAPTMYLDNRDKAVKKTRFLLHRVHILVREIGHKYHLIIFIFLYVWEKNLIHLSCTIWETMTVNICDHFSRHFSLYIIHAPPLPHTHTHTHTHTLLHQ